MPRFKLLIEYAGTRYSGWQIQKNARTVQGEIDRAIREAFRPREFELYGSGRTDAGVHALAQVAHLDLYTSATPEQLRRKLNDELPADINIIAVDKVPHRFHARHDAVARSYVYQISRRRTAFGKPFVWWIKEPLDVGAMRRSGRALRGHEGLPRLHGRRRRREVDAGARRGAGDRRGGTADPHPRARLALPVEDGAADRRRARRGRPAGASLPRDAISADLDVAALTAPAAGLFLEGVYYAATTARRLSRCRAGAEDRGRQPVADRLRGSDRIRDRGRVIPRTDSDARPGL